MNTLTLIDTGLTTEELIHAAYAEGARDAAERMASEISNTSSISGTSTGAPLKIMISVAASATLDQPATVRRQRNSAWRFSSSDSAASKVIHNARPGPGTRSLIWIALQRR